MFYMLFLFIAFILTFFSRYIFREQFPNIVDSVVSALAVSNFNLQLGEPPAPGYFLYIMLGKLIAPLFSDPFFALTFLSIFFAAASVVVLSLLARSLFGRTVGILTALLYMTSGTFWFFGISTLVYIVSFFFHITTVYSIVLLIKKERSAILLVAGSLAALLATRTHELIHVSFLLPFIPLFVRRKKLLLGGTVFIFLMLLWTIPLMLLSGGLQSYLKEAAIAASGIQQPSLANTRFYLNTIAGGFLGSFSYGTILFLYPIFRYILIFLQKPSLSLRLAAPSLILTLWITPILTYQVIFKSDHPSHTLALLGPATIIMAVIIQHLSADLSLFTKNLVHRQHTKNVWLVILFSVIAFSSVFRFFRDFVSSNPPYLTASSVHRRNQELVLKKDFIKSEYDPKETWIIVDQRRWVPISYSFPDYTIVTFEDASRTGELFQYSVGFVKQHQRSSVKRESFTFRFPEEVKTAIFFDDHFKDWLKSPTGNIIKLSTFSLTTLEDVGGDELSIHYHELRHTPSR